MISFGWLPQAWQKTYDLSPLSQAILAAWDRNKQTKNHLTVLTTQNFPGSELVLTRQRFLFFQELAPGKPDKILWHYRQRKTSSTPTTRGKSKLKNRLVWVPTSGDTLPSNGMISTIYKLLMSQKLPHFTFQATWQHDLQRLIEQLHWNAIWSTSLLTSRSYNIQMAAYKVMYRWYYTPHRLHKIFPDRSEGLWECGYLRSLLLVLS